MKSSGILKAVCAASITAAFAWSLAGCTSDGTASGSTGATAATVNGVEISEDAVTNQIENIRASYALDTDEAWGEWLAENDLTPQTLREEVIDSFVDKELQKQGSESLGISVDEVDLDEAVNKMKSKYATNEKWASALVQAGFSNESDYREQLKSQMLPSSLYASFASEEDPTDEEIIEVAKTRISSLDGAKRSSHILFDLDDEEIAQGVLDQINAGELDFAEAAKQYSNDGSAESGGDVGWDKMTQFVTEYQEALDSLEKDQVSGLVESQYGIHIIKCTDVFTAPEELTSTDQLPSEFVDSFKTNALQKKQSDAYQAWFDEYKAEADIVVNDMPEGLPYVIDMSAYQTDADDSSAASDDQAEDAAADAAGDEEQKADEAA